VPVDAQAQLDSFLDKYTPEVAALARALLDVLKARVPGASILVYDNYNALAIGFAADDRAGSVVLSIALYPRWINLFFMRGTELDDPDGLLKGSGNRVRHIPKITANLIKDERVDQLIGQTLAIAKPAIDPDATGKLIIKSVLEKQRPRRPKD
jgi:hypothetical protein